MSKVRCSVCSEKFEEMAVDTIEFTYRYFTDDKHRFNKSDHVKMCKKCTQHFLDVINMSMGVNNDSKEE